MGESGQIVILNGAPRSGKSSIVAALQDLGPWVNVGVDGTMASLPASLHPGIGLRPGGERPDLEDTVVRLYAALYESVAAHARLGFNVVVDVGHHDAYSRPLGILPTCASILAGRRVLWVGVRCPVPVVLTRRAATWGQTPADPAIVAAASRWDSAVHAHGHYDLSVDTSVTAPAEAAETIVARLESGPPGAGFFTPSPT